MYNEPDSRKAARDYVTSPARDMLIGGNWVPALSGATFDTIDPSTGERLCAVAEGAAMDVDRAVRAATKAFEAPSWGQMSPYDRGKVMHRIADLIEQHADELAAIQSHDMGMLLWQTQWMVAGAAEVFRYYAGWVTKIFGNTFPDRGPGLSYTRREPLGVVGAIIPWNGPSGATAWKIAPAIACGNTVVLKPAEQAPLVSLRMGELIQEAGLPDGVVNIVTGAAEAGSALVAHPGVAKISFTGSTDVGKRIVAAGAATVKKVSLELGGKSPTIIFPDADLDKAVASAISGFSIAAGQGCVAGSRVLIHESIYEDVADRITSGTAALKVGGAFDSAAEIPAIISQEQLDRVTGYIETGRAEGATLTCGGERLDRAGYFVAPTVFTQVSPSMRIAQEEIFGPVGALMPFKDVDEAIRLANGVEYGLSASIWTGNIGTAQIVSTAAQAGIVWINTLFELDIMAPFGGYKQSGIGRELGPESLDAYLQTKTVVLRF